VAISNDSIAELVPDSLTKENPEKNLPFSQEAKAAEKEKRRKVRVGIMMSIGLFCCLFYFQKLYMPLLSK
jgi:hypothetical protein